MYNSFEIRSKMQKQPNHKQLCFIVIQLAESNLARLDIYICIEMLKTQTATCRDQDSNLGYHGHNVGS